VGAPPAAQRWGNVGDSHVVQRVAVLVDARLPGGLRYLVDRVELPVGARPPDRELPGPALDPAAGGDVFQQFVGEPGPVQADEHRAPVRAGDGRDGRGQGGDVVGGVVGGGVAGSGVDDQDVVDVVADRQVGDEPDTAFVGRFGVLLAVAGHLHDGGVQVDDRGPGQLPPGHRQPGEPLGPGCQDAPPQAPEPAHGLVDPGHPHVVGLVQAPPDRRGRGDRPDQLPQMPQRLEVPDRLPPGQLDQAQVQQHLAPVVVRGVAGAAHRGRQPSPQPGPLGQQPHRQQPGQRHAPLVVPDQFQPSRP
jgi:hypothetical protein